MMKVRMKYSVMKEVRKKTAKTATKMGQVRAKADLSPAPPGAGVASDISQCCKRIKGIC